ncbi:MAG: phosphatidylserine decarboxylase [Deferribacteraceae bacterium]|jgi:phosphatidylserine decarboxylase|nr:phosphatidylserine decarboxylase [Deferribacteraceae bacterium]
MFAKDGYPFIIVSGIVLVVLVFLPKSLLVFLAVLAFAMMLWFFRDPERISPHDEKAIVSAADGRVVEISDVVIDGDKYKKISVFMNVFSVHVNRMPFAGIVERINHIAGGFVNAAKPEASASNERQEFHVRTAYGKMIITQVAGLVARRTVTYLEPGASSSKGDRIGMIKFSSRVDHYLPESVKPEVSLGTKVKAGISTIAKWS